MKKLLLVFINLVICLSFTIDCIIAASVNKRPHPNIKYSSELTSRRRENVWLTCDSEIYCEGEVLHDVQLMRLFHDSKIFVDFKLRFPEKEITEKYKDLKQKEHGLVSRAKLKQFVEDNFERGNELEQWVPNDWTREPSVLEKVKDPRYKKWVYYLNTMWRVLSRRVKEEVLLKPEMYSLIYVPNGFVIPGGRFTELYYWDTFWIINGLLLCDMKDTVRGVIENLIHLVKLFGHVPNGSRIYYITRSQPPLLIQMLQTYYKATNDWEFVQENISYMDDEFNYWWENHMVSIEKDGGLYKLARYFSYHPTPRPESYREDYLIAHEMKEIESKEDFYIKIRSGAETGWDFSSRWFVKNKKNEGNLSDIATPQIVPVDLNAWLQVNAVILNEWYTKLGDTAKADEYAKRAQHLLDGITKVLWNEELGAWFDFDSVNKVTREYFYASNLTPLSTFSYPKSWNRNDLSKKIIKYIHANNINQYVGGVPTSLEETGEQWDFPNAWAPLQQVIVDGLDKLGTPESKEEAFRLANKWLQSNYRGYTEAHTMYEKYDVLRPGETGEGGEYVPQTGFGWTNGVILEFLDKYGENAEYSEKDEKQVAFEHGGLPREKKESDSDRLSMNLENVVLDS